MLIKHLINIKVYLFLMKDRFLTKTNILLPVDNDNNNVPIKKIIIGI